MASTAVGITPAKAEISGLRRSSSGVDLKCSIGSSNLRRSKSEAQLRCSFIAAKVSSTSSASTNNKSAKNGIFPFNFPIKSFVLDKGNDEEETGDLQRRANWVDRLMELRTKWGGKQINADDYCGVNYDDDNGDELLLNEEEDEEWNQEKFSRLLTKVSWIETKLFSKLAFLCNMAYVIPEIKTEDLRKYCGLQLVTSSVKKKIAAETKAKLEIGSTNRHSNLNKLDKPITSSKRPIHSSAAYKIAASAASYVCSRSSFLSLDDDSTNNSWVHEFVNYNGMYTLGVEEMYKAEIAAYVAAATMTVMVAAEEDARLEAANNLRSLHSSPCEWFVCDDPNTCIRCFVIQGSDSLASWQTNLLFEPTKFEDTEVLVHRGIYEAAKGIYDQFMPDILSYISKYGEKAKLRFIGHSLGGSLSLLVNLMLHSRGEVPSTSLLPVVTFGSPTIFCGGNKVLKKLGLDEEHICSVMMHRDIVPRAFSCNYPNQVAQVLKRLNGTFRSHHCLNSQKLLYSPMGKLFILQPDERSSPPHPLLPDGPALYTLNSDGSSRSALKAFLNSPHPLKTLSKLTAYGSGGTILRDHDSANYLKAINGLVSQQTCLYTRKSRSKRLKYWWPLLAGGHELVRAEMATS